MWQGHDLTSMKLRLKALEAKAAQDGILLTEGQIVALEKAKATRRRTRVRQRVSQRLRGAGHLASGCHAC